MKIALATLAVGARYQRAVRLGLKSKQHYCRRHGYDFIFRNQPFSNRPPSWDKIQLLLDTIDRFDVVFWSDADVLIVNPERRLEDIINPYHLSDEKIILISRDSAGNVNAGNFFVFNRPNTKSLLMQIWRQEQFIDHGWWENKAIMHLLETDPAFAAAVHVEEIRSNLFNAYCHVGDPARNYRAGDLLLHFAGVGDVNKVERMMKYHYLHTRTNIDLTRLFLAARQYASKSVNAFRRREDAKRPESQ